MTPRNANVAVVQEPPVFLNAQATTERAVDLIGKLAERDVKLIVFPETWLPGYPVWLDYASDAALWDHPPARALYRILCDNAVVEGDELLGTLWQASMQHGVNVVIGAHERDGGTLYNTTFYFDADGGPPQRHRKLTPTYTERLIWGQGDGSTLTVVDAGFARVGGLICWEHWLPLARAAMHAKGEHVHIAQWSAVKELHQIASRQYAFEGQCFVIASGCNLSLDDVLSGFDSLGVDEPDVRSLLASQTADADGMLLKGGSAIIAPNAEYVVEPVFGVNTVIEALLDMSLIAEGHLTMDSDGHYSRPDVFQLSVNTRPRANVTFENSD